MSAGVAVSDQAVVGTSGELRSAADVRDHILTKGWTTPLTTSSGGRVPASHVMALEDLPGVSSVPPVSKGTFACRGCREGRTMPSSADCPPSSTAWEIDPATLGPLTPIKEGGMGAVLASTWEGRHVVVKEVRSDKADERHVGQLLVEGRVLRSLRHEHVVEVFGVCSASSPVRVVMELVEGGSLRDWMKRDPPPPPGPETLRTGLGLLLGVCRGMAHIHSRGVAHFDLKPDNVLVTTGGVAKVADFGIARKFAADVEYRKTGIRTRYCGTRGYIAPELVKDGNVHLVTPMVDVWSFGTMVGKVMGYFGAEVVKALKPAFDCDTFVRRCTADGVEFRPTFEELAVELEVHPPCDHPCERRLVCGHFCKAPCSKVCPPCTEPSCINTCPAVASTAARCRAWGGRLQV